MGRVRELAILHCIILRMALISPITNHNNAKNIRPEVAIVLPITSNQEIILVRQYRHGAGEILLELPAGTFNPNQESPQAAAIREVKEETG